MKILLTGGSGLLGKEIQKYLNCVAPTHDELDITRKESIEVFLEDEAHQNFDTIIHCAAYTDVAKAEEEKEKCYITNVLGTENLVKAFSIARFIYISSEYCYKPCNYYALTKALGEEIVIKNHKKAPWLIIRTLFKKSPWELAFAFMDQWTTGDYVDVIAPMIVTEVLKETQYDVLHLGTGRKTMFQLARRTNPQVWGNLVEDYKAVKVPKDYV